MWWHVMWDCLIECMSFHCISFLHCLGSLAGIILRGFFKGVHSIHIYIYIYIYVYKHMFIYIYTHRLSNYTRELTRLLDLQTNPLGWLVGENDQKLDLLFKGLLDDWQKRKVCQTKWLVDPWGSDFWCSGGRLIAVVAGEKYQFWSFSYFPRQHLPPQRFYRLPQGGSPMGGGNWEP